MFTWQGRLQTTYDLLL